MSHSTGGNVEFRRVRYIISLSSSLGTLVRGDETKPSYACETPDTANHDCHGEGPDSERASEPIYVPW